MLKKTGSRLAIVFLALTFVFWLTSMVTPGWFVYSKKYRYYVIHKLKSHNDDESSRFPIQPLHVQTKEWKYSIFYYKVCYDGQCDVFAYSDLNSTVSKLLVTLQVESLVALILCAISGIMVIIRINYTARKYFIAVIIIPVAATLQCVLILATVLINISFNRTEINESFKFPYSILLSGLGTLLSIIAWVICVVVYNNERKEESQNQRQRMDHTEPLPFAELPF